jgi:hypothetical protein
VAALHAVHRRLGREPAVAAWTTGLALFATTEVLQGPEHQLLVLATGYLYEGDEGANASTAASSTWENVQGHQGAPMTTAFDLLARGLFPRELPPCFSTASFATWHQTGTAPPAQNAAELGYHNLARVGALRRHLGIPNPILQARLAAVMEANWTAIQTHLQSPPFSLTTPTPVADSRALEPASPLSDRAHKRAATRAAKKFLIRTDVAQFYHSIYTHALPWAIHTRPIAKTNRRNQMLFGNALDRAQQSAQHGQTIGVPIGPDTSLVLAEILLAPVDRALQARFPSLRGFRYLDDYELSCSSHAEAEDVLAHLQMQLTEMELRLNDKKTMIAELPAVLEEPWTAAVRDFIWDDGTPRREAASLMRYFDVAVTTAKLFPQEHVFQYALGRLRTFSIGQANIELYQHLLLSAMQSEPGTLPLCVAVLQDLRLQGHQLDHALLEESLNLAIERHGMLGQASEIVWALFACLLFRVRVQARNAQRIATIEDDFVAILALHAAQAGLSPQLNLATWLQSVNEDELYGRHWLLAYEVVAAGFFPQQTYSDQCFNAMLTNNVRFFHPPNPAVAIELSTPGVGAGDGTGY